MTAERTVIESLGVYLPPRSVSTDTVLAGCAGTSAPQVELLTGISSRRVADGEFSEDLAFEAAQRCLAMSRYRPEDIDVLISAGISRTDGDRTYVLYPPAASFLQDRLGCHNAYAFDVNNACAGFFTALLAAEAFLDQGHDTVMIVSGEHITPLTAAAQEEIAGPADPRLACLTLGDAGAAIVVHRRPGRAGVHELSVNTHSEHSSLCRAHISEGPHQGLIMLTDSVPLFAQAFQHGFAAILEAVERHGWSGRRLDSVILHQASASIITAAATALADQWSGDPPRVVLNVADRGNTASTSHLVALHDEILRGRIVTGERLAFGVVASGLTVGTCLYAVDDLPDRVRRAAGRPAA